MDKQKEGKRKTSGREKVLLRKLKKTKQQGHTSYAGTIRKFCHPLKNISIQQFVGEKWCMFCVFPSVCLSF
jgi:hypothetical protein